MFATYCRIFERLGLEYRAVNADTGSIGGNASNEFHVLADSGEDSIAFSSESGYAANVELAEAIAAEGERPAPSVEMQTIDTPNQHSVSDVAAFLKIEKSQILKTLLVQGENDAVIALLLAGNRELNAIKAEKLEGIIAPLELATEAQVIAVTGCKPGSVGPIGLDIPIYADFSTQKMADFVCGANKDGKHYTGVNWQRDLPEVQFVDIRNVVDGDPSPDGKGTLSILRGIEVGHIFQLGKKYSEALNATVLNENGKAEVVTMGCYGIGVSRLVAASIEQNFDDQGIVWPEALAPFQISLVPLNYHKSEQVRKVAEQLHQDLLGAGYDVLLDDRKMQAGAMFSDHELLGIPHRIVISDRGLKEDKLEYKARTSSNAKKIATTDIIKFIKSRV
jgi:prolyl-tRNA synthetase